MIRAGQRNRISHPSADNWRILWVCVSQCRRANVPLWRLWWALLLDAWAAAAPEVLVLQCRLHLWCTERRLQAGTRGQRRACPRVQRLWEDLPKWVQVRTMLQRKLLHLFKHRKCLFLNMIMYNLLNSLRNFFCFIKFGATHDRPHRREGVQVRPVSKSLQLEIQPHSPPNVTWQWQALWVWKLW